MRVLMINSVCGRQSTGRIASGIQDILIENGHECSVAYGEKNSVVKKEDYHIGNEVDRYLHVLSTRVFDNTGLCSKNPTKELIKFVKNYNPDIIHLHNLHGYYINYKILFEFLIQFKKPVVWTLHDCWSFTGHCAHFDAIKCEKWKTKCKKCPQRHVYPKSFVDNSEKNYLNKKRLFSDKNLNLTIVTPSDWLAKFVKESFLGDRDVRVIRNGIDLSVFQPINCNKCLPEILKNKKIILGVANPWNESKGFYDYVKLQEMLSDEFQVVLIGVDKKQKEYLDKKNVYSIEKTDSIKQLVEWYSVADFFVNLTYEDNFPTVNLEALACGTPVITYRTGGSTEAIDHTSGISVRQGDIEGICDAIYSKKFNSTDCVNRSKEYEKNKCFKQYIDLYESIDRMTND